MKKYTKFAYIILIVIVLASVFFVFKIVKKDNSNENIEEKTLSEIKHLESEFQNLFNQLDNISFEKYKISSSEIKQEEKESSNESKDSGGTEGESSDESNSSKGDSEESEAKQYKIEENGILTKDSEIDWNQIKNNVERIYVSLYPMTVDLYQIYTNQQDIVNFNKEYDNLIKIVKDEDKQVTLNELSILYDYLPKFVEACTDKEKEKVIIKTKSYIFKAYSVLEEEKWENVSENVDSAIQEFSKIVTNESDRESRNQYTLNKAYVMIKELQNAINLRDKEVFLIKYKNLLEELQNM